MDSNPRLKRRSLRWVFISAGALILLASLTSLALAVAWDWEPADTIIVAKTGRADYSTIGEALQNAPPNSRIRVRPGVYREGFPINKPVEIVGSPNDETFPGRIRRFLGSGSAQEVVIESADSPCIGMRTERAIIRGVTLRCFGQANSRSFPAVAVLEGNLILEDCKITCESFAGVALYGVSASCTIRRCTISECGLNGVLAGGGASAVLEDCEVASNRFAGIRVEGEAKATVRRVNVRDGASGGVLVLDKASVSLEDCFIYGNELSGLEVRESGNALVTSSRIQHNKGPGAHIHDKGNATLNDCDISHNSGGGVSVFRNSSVELTKCKIHEIPRNGVEVCENSTAVLESCSIFANTGCGVITTTGSTLTMRGCETKGNSYFGIQVHTEANPHVQQCTIRDGLLVTKNGRGVFEDCDFVNTASKHAVTITAGGNPNLRRCKVRDGFFGGIFIHSNGTGVVEDCDISGNKSSGIGIGKDGSPLIRRCRINRNGEPGVIVFADGRGRVEDCDLTENTGGAWSDEGKNKVERTGNKGVTDKSAIVSGGGADLPPAKLRRHSVAATH